MSIGEEIFDNSERVYVNHLLDGEDLKIYKRQNLLAMLNFQMSILTDVTDEDIRELISSTHSKVNLMTDEEFENLKAYLPLDCFDGTEDDGIYY